ncbi:MAG: DUF3887 domain-containing protein [Deltaproteobacteria bacterium]|nr:DUF3887 domain-containing protein [Deltaproteobacteria bacterium]
MLCSVLLLGASSCQVITGGLSANRAKEAAEEFYRLRKAGRYDEIHRSASDKFRAGMSAEALRGLLVSLEQNFGPYQAHRLMATSMRQVIGGGESGSRAILTYRVIMERAELKETLVYLLSGDDAVLLDRLDVGETGRSSPEVKPDPGATNEEQI